MKSAFNLTFNPFSPAPIFGEGVGNLFVNRKEELQRANDFISFHEAGIVLVVGDYGIGKTSFLWKLAHDLADHALVANVVAYRFDLDKIGFLRGVLLTLLHTLKGRVKTTTFQRLQAKAEKVLYTREVTSREHIDTGLTVALGLGREKEVKVVVTPNIYDVQEVMDEILRESTKISRRVVLLIDELDKAPPEVASSLLLLARTLFGVPGVFLIAVVSKGTMEYLGHEIRVARSISDTEIVLSPLTTRDSIELVDRRLTSARAPTVAEMLDDPALRAILDYSEGNPSRLVGICSQLFSVLLKEKRLKITYSDIARIIDVRREGLMSQLVDREVKLLVTIEKRGRIRAGDPDIIKVLRVSRPRASQILRKLLQMGMLTAARDGKSVYYSVSRSIKPLLKSIAVSHE